MTTTRLDKSMESAIYEIAEKKGISRSEIIREGIKMYLRLESQNPYESGKSLFGKYKSGIPDLAQNSEKYLRNKFGTKK